MNKLKALKKDLGDMRQLEMEGAKLFGKHVSKEKAAVLLVLSLAVCALPMVMGLRLLDQMPELIPSGMLKRNGEADSFPRWVAAFGQPAFLCLLNLITHVQLWIHQTKMVPPPGLPRVLGRWGIPVFSMLYCSFMVQTAVGQVVTDEFWLSCLAGLALLILGSHMWECPKEARVALRFPVTEKSPEAWKKMHGFAGWLWMAAGLVLLAALTLSFGTVWLQAAALLVSLASPAVFGVWLSRQ